MSTVFNRLYAYSRNNNVEMPATEWRIHLGIKALQLYKKSGIEKPYKHTQASPFDAPGTNHVLKYPIEFREALDGLIKDFYDNPPSEPLVYVPRKKSDVPREPSTPKFPSETFPKIKSIAIQSIEDQLPKENLKKRKRIPIIKKPIFSTKNF